MRTHFIAPTGLSESEHQEGDEVAIVFPKEFCRFHKETQLQPESAQWSSQIKFFSTGYNCPEDKCMFSLKVLRDSE